MERTTSSSHRRVSPTQTVLVAGASLGHLSFLNAYDYDGKWRGQIKGVQGIFFCEGLSRWTLRLGMLSRRR